MTGANDYLFEHAPGLLDNIGPLGSTTTTDFDGDYANSSKQPDGGITRKSGSASVLQWI
ncbi:hypothetical protein V1504DRAFT_463654 [Lipomyces starkeyi]